MERLTTNKNVSEMGMYELAMNSCYSKDGLARYRDFEKDVDARELTRELLKKYAEGDDAFEDVDAFDDEMLDLLQYGTDTIEGLIALFYLNLWTKADLRERLKAYEDAEEQGLLLRLPCKIGDEFYVIAYSDKKVTHVKCTGYLIQEDVVNKIKQSYVLIDSVEKEADYWRLSFEEFENQCFLTQEEAEKALADMGV